MKYYGYVCDEFLTLKGKELNFHVRWVNLSMESGDSLT
jgi:hypothetical protein